MDELLRALYEMQICIHRFMQDIATDIETLIDIVKQTRDMMGDDSLSEKTSSLLKPVQTELRNILEETQDLYHAIGIKTVQLKEEFEKFDSESSDGDTTYGYGQKNLHTECIRRR